MNVTSRSASIAVAGVAALSLALPTAATAAAHHQGAPAAKGTHTIKKGTTKLSVDVGNYLNLSKDGFKVAPTGKAKLSGTTVTFPVTGGKVNPAKLTGTVKQTGGLSISNGTTTIVIKNAVAHLKAKDATASVTGKGSDFVALTISKPTSVKSTSKKATFTGYTVKFSKQAIAYLDKKFATKDFKKYAELGTATTKVTFK